MANFPTSLDSISNPAATDPLNNPSHSTQHGTVNDIAELLEAKVGVDGSAVTTSLDYYIQHGVVPKEHAWQGDISPSAIAAQADNYNPTGLSTAAVIRVTLTGNQDLTGLSGGADGRLIIVHNVDTVDTLTLKDESASSTAGNRFALTADFSLLPDGVCLLQYDSTSSRWRLIGGGAAISTATPQAVSTSGSAGTGTKSSADDHVHAHEAAHLAHDTLWAAKGDLVAGTANDTAAILSVGANGKVLVADSAETTGLKWSSGATITKSIFFKANEFELDSGTANTRGTSPDIVDTVALADGSTQGLFWSFNVPQDWAGGALTMKVWWIGTSTETAKVVRFAHTYLHVPVDTGATGAGTTTITDTASKNITNNSTNTQGSLTLGTPALAGDIVRVQLERRGGHANDTYTGGVNIVLIEVTYTASGGGAAGAVGTFYGASVYNSANQTVNTSLDPVLYDTELFDTDGIHSTSSNTGRLTAARAGYYFVQFFVYWDNAAITWRRLDIYKNGSGGTQISINVVNANAATNLVQSVTGLVNLGVGDYVTSACSVSAGSRSALGGQSSTHFEMFLVGT